MNVLCGIKTGARGVASLALRMVFERTNVCLLALARPTGFRPLITERIKLVLHVANGPAAGGVIRVFEVCRVVVIVIESRLS